MISNISFGNNKVPYVHEGTVFAEKEAKKAAQKVKEALELDWIRNVLEQDTIHTFERPDALIIPPIVEKNKSVESYVLSHGGQMISGNTIATV